MKVKIGDVIKIKRYIMGRQCYDTTHKVEEFRQCLGIFLDSQHREAGAFTPLCELYEPAPDSELGYVSNFGEYYKTMVPTFEIIG